MTDKNRVSPERKFNVLLVEDHVSVELMKLVIEREIPEVG